MGDMTALGLREAKRRATAHALAEAAFDLAVERGVDGFTIDDIASRAGYSRRTFANHFSCKEEAITGLAVERLRQGLETLPDLPEDTPLLDWLMVLARHQLSGGMLPLLQQLRGMVREHHGLEPYLADVQLQIRRMAQEAVAARAGSNVSRLSSHILVGAAYGALMSVLDGRVPIRLPGDSEQPSSDDDTADEAISMDEFLATVFTHLRRGF